MSEDPLDAVTTLTFDVFGTVLDLRRSLTPPLERFLLTRETDVDADALWRYWRARQRLEQFQDSLLMKGHSGYLETCRRALVYCLREHGIEYEDAEVAGLIEPYKRLAPFADAVEGLRRLQGRYKLVALSNGEPWLLVLLVANQIRVEFDRIISVEEAGFFKPHPSVYVTAARLLAAEPQELMMVAAHGFDIVGARACGYRGAYVDRYGLPSDESPYRPDLVVKDFAELADRLVGDDSTSRS